MSLCAAVFIAVSLTNSEAGFNVHGILHLQYMLSITNKMQRSTIFFIAVKALNVSMSFNSTTLAVAATELDKYQILYLQF